MAVTVEVIGVHLIVAILGVTVEPVTKVDRLTHDVHLITHCQHIRRHIRCHSTMVHYLCHDLYRRIDCLLAVAVARVAITVVNIVTDKDIIE